MVAEHHPVASDRTRCLGRQSQLWDRTSGQSRRPRLHQPRHELLPQHHGWSRRWQWQCPRLQRLLLLFLFRRFPRHSHNPHRPQRHGDNDQHRLPLLVRIKRTGGSGSISGYKIYRGGSQVGTTGNTTYTDTNLTASTTYTYTVAAYDSNGNTSSQSGSVQATTGSDTTPPSVSISSPANGVTVSSTVTVQASASDNVGVTKVEFYLDGFLQTTDTTSPYTWSWNTASSTNGSHTLSAKAYDAAGNMGGSSNVSVTVSNPDTTPPTIPTGLGITGSTTSTISLSWTASTDNVGVTGYKVYRCTGACSPTTQIGTSTATSFTDTLLNQSTTYSYAVSAYDAAGTIQASHRPPRGPRSSRIRPLPRYPSLPQQTMRPSQAPSPSRPLHPTTLPWRASSSGSTAI